MIRSLTIALQAATPIDVVKTRIQVDPSLAGQNMLKAGRSIIANEGASALLTGFGPTAVVSCLFVADV